MTPAGLHAKQFGLEGAPFEAAPDSTCVYWSAQHRRAFSVLEYGLMSSATFSVLIGPTGSGKTLLARVLAARHNTEITLTHLQAGPWSEKGILGSIEWALAEGSAAQEPGLLRLGAVLNGPLAERGLRVVVIDEAQNLTPEDVEHLRLLANVQPGRATLMRFILVGQEDLGDLITGEALAQRISARARLQALNAEDTAAYVRFRLRQAGGTADEIEPEALKRVHELSGGLPRRINQICDLALTYAAVESLPRVTVEILRDIAEEAAAPLGGWAKTGSHERASL